MEDEIVSKILDLLQPLCPSVDLKHPYSAYYTSCIREIVERYKRIDNPFTSSYSEHVRVDILNNVIEQIKVDILENMTNYLWPEDIDKSEYEKTVLNVIRLIQFRVHCICDY